MSLKRRRYQVVELIPVEGAHAACILFATCTIGAGGSATAAVICWRRARTRCAAYDHWITEETNEKISTGDDLFDRWTEALQRQTGIKTVRQATALWCIATALHMALAVIAETGCL